MSELIFIIVILEEAARAIRKESKISPAKFLKTVFLQEGII